MKKLHVIYITGLGDNGPNPQGQRTIISTWRWYGVEPEFFQMNWGDKKPWESKFSNLLASIDNAYGRGMPVALVGASAGASAAINAYAARKDKVVGVVVIAAKVNHPETVGNAYKKNNPAFVTSILASPNSIKGLNTAERRRILSKYGLYDEVVRKADSYIPGAHNERSFSAGHFLTIAYQISVGAPKLLWFLRRQLADS